MSFRDCTSLLGGGLRAFEATEKPPSPRLILRGAELPRQSLHLSHHKFDAEVRGALSAWPSPSPGFHETGPMRLDWGPRRKPGPMLDHLPSRPFPGLSLQAADLVPELAFDPLLAERRSKKRPQQATMRTRPLSLQKPKLANRVPAFSSSLPRCTRAARLSEPCSSLWPASQRMALHSYAQMLTYSPPCLLQNCLEGPPQHQQRCPTVLRSAHRLRAPCLQNDGCVWHLQNPPGHHMEDEASHVTWHMRHPL